MEFLYLSKASEVLTLAHDGAGMVRCLESDRQRPSLAQALAEIIRQTITSHQTTSALAVLQLHLFELAHPKEKHLKVVLTSSICVCAKWIEIPKLIKMDHLRKLFAVCVDALPASD